MRKNVLITHYFENNFKMNSFIFCFFLVIIICNSQGFVNCINLNLWGYFNDNNSKEKMLIDRGQGYIISY